MLKIFGGLFAARWLRRARRAGLAIKAGLTPPPVGASLSRDLLICLVIWFLILIYRPLREAVRRGKAFLGTFVAV